MYTMFATSAATVSMRQILTFIKKSEGGGGREKSRGGESLQNCSYFFNYTHLPLTINTSPTLIEMNTHEEREREKKFKLVTPCTAVRVDFKKKKTNNLSGSNKLQLNDSQ